MRSRKRQTAPRASVRSVVSQLPPPRLIQRADDLAAMLDHLLTQPKVAVDTEANSLYAYYHQVCLIQFSVPGADYLVDPLALDDLSPLGELFASPDVEKIFHAAENDVLMLKRDYRFRFARLFDTMIAARILGWPRVGLAALLEEHFGVHLDKRMQRTNWGKRPLSPDQLAYARLDTYYLIPLRDRLHQELVARGRWQEALEAFAALPDIEFVEKPFDPEGFWRIHGARELAGRQLAVLREVYLWREECARQGNLPPFKVLSDRALVLLSKRQPSSVRALQEISGIPASVRRRFGRQLVTAVRRGLSAPIPTPPRRQPGNHTRPDEATMARYEALRAWRGKKAIERGVEPDVVLTNDTLMQIARRNPRTLEELAEVNRLGPWKLRTYGPELLDVISRVEVTSCG